MGKYVDLTGQRFGMLTVLERAEKANTKGKVYWVCKCDCGKEKLASTCNLKSGSTRSCGCSKGKIISAALTKHNARHKKIYKIGEAMKRRCDCPKSERYKSYGARGIKYCNDWKSFIGFYDWALSAGYKEGLSLDRINVNGNYEPTNCRWIPLEEQGYNKTVSFRIQFGDKSLTAAEWSKITGISASTIYQRIKKLGWSAEDALSIPTQKRGRPLSKELVGGLS